MRDRVQFEMVVNAGTSAVRNSLVCKGKTQHAFLMRLGTKTMKIVLLMKRKRTLVVVQKNGLSINHI
jgi:hypothetical protein